MLYETHTETSKGYVLRYISTLDEAAALAKHMFESQTARTGIVSLVTIRIVDPYE